MIGKEVRGMKISVSPTLCLNMISFAMHAGGPVSRTGFPRREKGMVAPGRRWQG